MAVTTLEGTLSNFFHLMTTAAQSIQQASDSKRLNHNWKLTAVGYFMLSIAAHHGEGGYATIGADVYWEIAFSFTAAIRDNVENDVQR